jgi:hypothetical protein
MEHALKGHVVLAPYTGRTERKRPGGLDIVWLIILKGIWNSYDYLDWINVSER